MKFLVLLFSICLSSALMAESSTQIIVSARVLAHGKIQAQTIETETTGNTDRIVFAFKIKTNTGSLPGLELKLARESRDEYYINGQLLGTTEAILLDPKGQTELTIIRAENELEFTSNLILSTLF